MAGGALGGVLGSGTAAAAEVPGRLIHTPFYGKEGISQIVSALFFTGLSCTFGMGRCEEKEI